jgi:hypothetical protein
LGCAHDAGGVYFRADTSDAVRQADYKECQADTGVSDVAVLFCTPCLAVLHACMTKKGYEQHEVAR